MNRIGRPTKYLKLIEALGDEELYSLSRIADLSLEIYGPKTRRSRVKAAMAARARRHFFPSEGDRQVEHEGQAAIPAWYGSRWKETVAHEIGATPPEVAEENVDFRDRGLGNRMKYDQFITQLDLFELYAVHNAFEQGVEAGLLPNCRKSEESKVRRRVRQSILQYAKSYLPEEPDGYFEQQDGKQAPAWRGWRWQLALPDYALSIKEKEAIRALVAESPDSSGPESDARQQKNRRRFKKPARYLMAAMVLIVFGSIGFAIRPSFVNQGFNVLKSSGPQAAYDFFGGDAAEVEKRNDTDWGRAWAAYRIGKFEEAESLARVVMDKDNDYRAASYYLLGLTSTATMAFDEAMYYFEQSLKHYELMESPKGLSVAHMGIAHMLMDRYTIDQDHGYLEKAAQHLDRAEFYWEPSGDHYSARARLAFETQDYELGLEYSIRTKDFYLDDPDQMASAISGEAFFLMLLGDVEEGYRLSLKAEAIAFELKDDKKYHFNLINEVLYRLHYGLPVDELMQMLNKYQLKKPDPYLAHVIRFLRERESFQKDEPDASQTKSTGEFLDPREPEPPPVGGTSGGGGGAP
jgi:hypothetical protein